MRHAPFGPALSPRTSSNHRSAQKARFIIVDVLVPEKGRSSSSGCKAPPAAAVKLRRDDVCAKLQTQADERLHHGHGAMRAVA